MRPEVDTLQASLMTSGGLSEIDKGFNIFTVPFFFESDAEVVAVQKALEPRLEQGLQAQGFHLVSWGSGGWIEIFSKKPIKTLAELKASKLYASQNDDVMMQWYTRNGFHPQQIPLADIGPALKLVNGAIDTAPNNPYVAMATQIYTDANYMLDVHVAPLVGAIIIAKRVWDPLSDADKANMTEAARAMETKIRSEITSLDASSLKAMSSHGLHVITPDPKALLEFRAAGVDMASTLRGTIPNDVFQTASAERDRVRKLK
jgi:TRAP-type C4-dicarboxylate transport system substrate-binding protein